MIDEPCVFCAIVRGEAGSEPRVRRRRRSGVVFHVHLHVFPRFAGDSFRSDADWRIHERQELDETAAAVRHGLSSTP